MFDRLIASETVGSEVKSRRNYFLVSSIAVAILFTTGVVFSIFAGDFNLGNSEFELQSMLAPVEMTADAPQPKQTQPVNRATTTSTLPTRTVNMSRPDEPTIVPDGISTARNTVASRPNAPFNIGKVDSDPGTSGPVGRNDGTTSGTNDFGKQPPVDTTSRDTEPDIKLPPPNKKVTISRGVVNGMAIALPKPNYSAAAKAMRASGKVDVQILIDESGRVVSAKAMSGNPILREAAEQAARNAKFSVTMLSGTPVKVTGVIVYNFVLG